MVYQIFKPTLIPTFEINIGELCSRGNKTTKDDQRRDQSLYYNIVRGVGGSYNVVRGLGGRGGGMIYFKLTT